MSVDYIFLCGMLDDVVRATDKADAASQRDNMVLWLMEESGESVSLDEAHSVVDRWLESWDGQAEGE